MRKLGTVANIAARDGDWQRRLSVKDAIIRQKDETIARQRAEISSYIKKLNAARKRAARHDTRLVGMEPREEVIK